MRAADDCAVTSVLVRLRTWALPSAVLLAWLSVVLFSALPESARVAQGQRFALSAVTVLSAVAVLSVACRRAGGPTVSRLVWLLLGTGLAGYAGGFVVQFWVSAGEGAGPGGLNLSDCSSLLLYPLAHAGLVVLTRRRAGRADSGSMLEGAVVFCGAAAVVVVLVALAYPALLTGSLLQIVYALAYPVGGFTLLVATLTGFSLAGGRADQVWVLLLVGFAVMTVGDALYGVAMVAGRFRYGSYLDAPPPHQQRAWSQALPACVQRGSAQQDGAIPRQASCPELV